MIRQGLAIIAMFACLAAVTSGAMAANEVPKGDWSYAAVQDLAGKGLVQGYPSKADIFGNRTVNRYEMAALVSRVVARLVDDQQAVQAAAPQTREEISKLLQDYGVELTVMGTDISNLKLGLQSVTDTLQDQQKSISAVKKQADSDYGNTQAGKYSITGYIQARAVDADSGNKKLYPAGAVASATSSGAASALSGAYNGNYGQGGAADAMEVRRARILFLGKPSANSYYRAQIDVSGAITNSTTPVKVKEAADYYTPGDGSSKYPTIGMGQFAVPFGYVLPTSSSVILSPERPVAFTEVGTFGLFNGQDYDKGLKVYYGPGNIKFTYALINGAGTNSENVYNHFDSVGRVGYSTPDKVFNVGASFYDGEAYESTVPKGVQPKKDLLGVDAQIKPLCGAFLDAEYVAGTYETRYYFTNGITAPVTANTDAYVKGNQVQGYYVWGGYTFNQASPRPLTLGADYDVFQRSKSTSGGTDQLTAGTGATNKSNSSYDDVNWGLGALYNLDKATRLRLWWDQPVSIAHAPKALEPTKVGLLTGEVQLSF